MKPVVSFRHASEPSSDGGHFAFVTRHIHTICCFAAGAILIVNWSPSGYNFKLFAAIVTALLYMMLWWRILPETSPWHQAGLKRTVRFVLVVSLCTWAVMGLLHGLMIGMLYIFLLFLFPGLLFLCGVFRLSRWAWLGVLTAAAAVESGMLIMYCLERVLA